MDQLIMNWVRKADSKKWIIDFPEGFSLRNFHENDADIDIWLDLMQYGLTNGKQDPAFFKACMQDHPHYSPDSVFFVEHNAVPCASITILCDYTKKHGYIHMVCASPSIRGLGIGKILAYIAVNELIDRGMETAHLTTDDFRLAAIKTYLAAGFEPQRSGSADFSERWDAIMKKL